MYTKIHQRKRLRNICCLGLREKQIKQPLPCYKVLVHSLEVNYPNLI